MASLQAWRRSTSPSRAKATLSLCVQELEPATQVAFEALGAYEDARRAADEAATRHERLKGRHQRECAEGGRGATRT